MEVGTWSGELHSGSSQQQPAPSSSGGTTTETSSWSPNAGNQPQVVEVEQSFGFVEVGDGELEGGGYKLKRNSSTVVLTSEGVVQQQRQIESLQHAMQDLRVEFERLKQKVLEFEEENHQWSQRYSRRMAVLANASLGSWIFWSRFIHFVKRHKSDFIQGWLRSSSRPSTVATRAAAPFLLRKSSFVPKAIMGGGVRPSRPKTFNKLFNKSYIFAIRHSWVFLLSAYFINKKGFRRWAGLIASTCYSVYLTFFTNTMPWTSYFTIFANLLYITACLKGMTDSENEVPSLFNLNKRGHDGSPSTTSANGSNNVVGSVAIARNNSFGSRHSRNQSRGRKISIPPLTLPIPSLSSSSSSPSSGPPSRRRSSRSSVQFLQADDDVPSTSSDPSVSGCQLTEK
jgi:hypothetical protein